MAKTRECCGALSLRRTGGDLHVSLHKGFKIRLAGIVPVFIEFTAILWLLLLWLPYKTFLDPVSIEISHKTSGDKFEGAHQMMNHLFYNIE